MEIAIAILTGTVIYLIVTVQILKKDLKERTTLHIDDDGVGGKVIRNDKGEIILEL